MYKMKQSDRLLFRENHFSWRRLAMIIRLYWPTLRGMLLFFTLLSFIITFSIGIYNYVTHSTMPNMAFYTLGLLGLIAPLTITRRDFRDVSSQLPVTAGEKTMTLIVFYWIAFPVAISLAQWGADRILNVWLGIDVMTYYMTVLLSEFETETLAAVFVTGTIQTMCIVTVELYALVCSRKNRMLTGLGAAAATMAVLMVISIMTFFCIGVWFGLNASDAEVPMQEEMMAEGLKMALSLGMKIMLAASSVITVIATYKLHKRLNNSGF